MSAFRPPVRSTISASDSPTACSVTFLVLRLLQTGNTDAQPKALDEHLQPQLTDAWQIGVLYGPHGAPDFFTTNDIERSFSSDFEVHYNSARTGIRLIGPQPEWARSDGGEAGLHPSNIHDNAYAFGSI